MVQLQKKRIEELDMIKGIAIVLVFFRHINEMTGISNLGNFYTHVFSTFFELFMLLFFFCSGYVFSTKGTVLQNIRKKAKQLLLPILKFHGAVFLKIYCHRKENASLVCGQYADEFCRTSELEYPSWCSSGQPNEICLCGILVSLSALCGILSRYSDQKAHGGQAYFRAHCICGHPDGCRNVAQSV